MHDYPHDFDALHNISEGRHLYQFYKNFEDYLEAMANYFHAGLEKGEACLWLASEKLDIEKICAALEKKIPQFLFHHSSGQFQILSAELWYLNHGAFNEEQAVANAGRYIEQIQKQGFHCLRGAGDAGAIPYADWPKLDAYERKMDSVIKSLPLIAVCAYPILNCTLQDTKMVLDCHDGVMVGHV